MKKFKMNRREEWEYREEKKRKKQEGRKRKNRRSLKEYWNLPEIDAA